MRVVKGMVDKGEKGFFHKLRGRPLPQGEAFRKVVHATMGLFALALPFLSLGQAMALAATAFLFNWLGLPRLLGHRFQTKRQGGSDTGVLLYPLVVLVCVGVYRHAGELAAFGWGVLAFGDALAGVVGQKWGRRPLPWHSGKTWEGFLSFAFGGLLGGSALALWYVAGQRPEFREPETLVSAFVSWLGWGLVPCVLGAVLESVPHGLDDNVLPPLLVPAIGLLGASATVNLASFDWGMAVVVNSLCAFLALMSKTLRPGGVLAAWVLGVATWAAGGWQAFVLLLAFLLAGLGATFWGFRAKRRLGLAEGHGGRRGAGEVLAKGGTLLALAFQGLVLGSGRGGVVGWAVVVTLAAAWADTWGSEIGKLLGGEAFRLPRGERVPPGTPGAVSWVGLVASGLGAVAASFLGYGLGLETRVSWVLLISLAAFIATLLESFLAAGGGTHAGRNLVVTSSPLLFLVAITGGSL
ncbi:MAG: DUF92 domain-containing protein [Thermoanaerobaculaceae bacterium]